MSAVLLAVVVIAVLLAVAVVVALPRLRAGRGRRPLARRRPTPDGAGYVPETEVADDARRPREERRLIAEGEAIREHVEANLAATERRPAHPVERDPLAERDELARQLEQEHRERYPASYGTAGAGYVAPADPLYGPPAGPGGPVPGARDELAWQIARDQRERDPAGYPVADGLRPVGADLQPATPAVSDALELQLQEVAVRARGVRRPVAGERPRRRFARSSRRTDVDPEDPRLAG